MKKVLLNILICMLVQGFVLAQTHCATTDPSTDATLLNKINLFFQEVECTGQPGYRISTAGCITVPIVVHVIHQGGVENITNSQIQSQIDVLNDDYLSIPGTPGGGPGVNTKIAFQLATVDPNGFPTNGIVRINNSLTNHDKELQQTQLKALSQWDPHKYLNIWIVKSITSNGSSNVLGYGRFPAELNLTPQLDGVVIGYQYFGDTESVTAPFNKGRTATHEIGHWLGLLHTFQGGCDGPNDCGQVGDRCCDTPPVASSSAGCLERLTCGHITQIENYMDYSDDACMNRFTADQNKIITFTLNNYRPNVRTSSSSPLASLTGIQNPQCKSSGFNVNASNISYYSLKLILSGSEVLSTGIVNFTQIKSGIFSLNANLAGLSDGQYQYELLLGGLCNEVQSSGNIQFVSCRQGNLELTPIKEMITAKEISVEDAVSSINCSCVPFVIPTLDNISFNYGFKSSHTVGTSLEVKNNGILYANSNRLTGFDSKPAPTPSSTSTINVCGGTITISNTGQFILGDNSTGNKAIVNFKSGSTLYLKSGSKLIINDGSKVVIEAGASFINESGDIFLVGPNSQFEIQGNTVLSVNNGQQLKINKSTASQGGTFFLNGGATALTLNVGSKLINTGCKVLIGTNSTLNYKTSVEIQLLGDNASLEFQGKLNIFINANFTFTYPGSTSGYVKFSDPVWPPDNLIVNSGARMTFNGSGQIDKILEIAQDALPAYSLANFSLTNGTCQFIGNGALYVDGPLTINNAKLTSTTGGYNAHRGLTVFGQGNVNISNSIFENGKYGLYAALLYGGTPLTLNLCTFRNNETGLTTVDKGATLNSCVFIDNLLAGWDAQGMSFASTMVNGSVNNTVNRGIKFTSASTGSLHLVSMGLHNNATAGVEYDGTTMLSITCAGITNSNGDGVLIKNGAKINLSPYQNPAGGAVIFRDNTNSINASCASQLFLNAGANDLNPLYLGGGKAIAGTFSGYGCVSNASTAQNFNKWKSNLTPPVNGVDYSINQCGCPHSNPITITDIFPIQPAACGAPGPSDQLVSGGETNLKNARTGGGTSSFSSPDDDPFENCNACRILNTTSIKGEKLNHALRDAIDKVKDKNKNYITTLTKLSEILENASGNANQEEKWFIDLSYEYMKTTIGAAYNEGIFSNPANGSYNTYVDRLMKIQDRKATKAKKDSLYKEEFYTALDKALLYRLAGKREIALTNLNSLVSLAQNEDMDIVNYWTCLIQKEQDLLNGKLAKEDFAEAIAICNESYNNKNSFVERVAAPNVNSISDNNAIQPMLGDNYPNPFNKNTVIESYVPESAAGSRIVIYNSMGSVVKTVALNPGKNKSEINAEELNAGIYFYSLFIGDTRIQTKRMSIVM